MEVKENQSVTQPDLLKLPDPIVHKDELDKSLMQTESETRGRETKKIDSLSELSDALREINKALEPKNIALNYSVDDSTDAIVVKVVEKQTDKVIRQIPPEEVLSIRGHIKEFLGVIYDQNG